MTGFVLVLFSRLFGIAVPWCRRLTVLTVRS
jgi:hypothetical protein